MYQFYIWHVISELIFISATRIYSPSEQFDAIDSTTKYNDDFETNLYLPRPEFIREWPTLNASKQLGPVSAAAVLEGDRFQTLVFHRADRYWDATTFDNQNRYRWQSRGPIKDGALVLLKDGKLEKKYLPKMLHLPHGLTVDHEGYVWITDVAMHQVFKIRPDLSTVELTLGEKFVPGEDAKHFCKPTSVAVSKNGDFFVADGYCNQRILKFRPNGTLITQWGGPSATEKGLLIPHQLAIIEKLDLICVADRENARVACYTAGINDNVDTGTYQFEVKTKGPVYGLAFDEHNDMLFALLGVESSIQLIDIYSQKQMGHLERNFGEAHTLATCPLSLKTGCLVVCSTEPGTSNVMDVEELEAQEPIRRLWLYKLQ